MKLAVTLAMPLLCAIAARGGGASAAPAVTPTGPGATTATPSPAPSPPVGQASVGQASAPASTLALTLTSAPPTKGDAAAGQPALPNGSWSLRSGGTVIARFVPRTPPLRQGTPSVRTVTVEGHPVVDIRVPVRGQPVEEVWIGELGTLPARVIWNGMAGPRGVDEETSLFVDVSPERILEYQTAAQVSRCDGEAVQLFPRAWDFAGHRFRPVVAAIPAPAAVTLTARRHDPAMPDARPLGGFRFVAASTTGSAGSDAGRLDAPGALNDGNPATAWAEGLGGDGRGEFLTARSFAGPYLVTGLRILPGDATSSASFASHNRLKSIHVAYGAAPAQSFDVLFPEDPAQNLAEARAPYWVPFPEPTESTCVTLTIREIYRGAEPGPAHAGTTAISDAEIFTDVDSPAGVDRLIADAAAGARCTARVPLLVNLGDAVVLPLAEAIMTASGPSRAGGNDGVRAGRECLVMALTAIPAASQSAIAVDALVAALHGASVTEEERILGVIRRGRNPPVAALAKVLRDPGAIETAGDRVIVARVLGQLPGHDAVAALLAAAGDSHGDGASDVRLAIVQALGQAPDAEVTLVASALSAPRNPDDARDRRRRADLLRTLPALVARRPADRPAALAILRESLAQSRDYETQARAIAALGGIGDPEAVADLTRLRHESEDAVLRFLATRELGGFATPAARAALRQALTDADPRVRETAAQGLRGAGADDDAAAEAALIQAAKSDPWPFARRAQIEALARTCGGPGRELLVRALTRDVGEVQRAALVGLVRCGDWRAPSLLLATLKARNANASLRELAAGLFGDVEQARPAAESAVAVAPAPSPERLAHRHGQAEVLAALVPSLVNEGEGDLAIEGVTVSALRSLGQLGGSAAARVVAPLTQDRLHPYRHVAVEVLGQICDPDVGARALRALRVSADPELALVARSSEIACHDRGVTGVTGVPARGGPPTP